jgi:hypothetical protein
MAKEKADKRFIALKGETNGLLTKTKIIVDKQTGVQYLFVAYGYGGGLTPLLNKDGTPLLYVEAD